MRATIKRCADVAAALTPQQIAGATIDRLHQRRARLGATDPVWSEIERRRRREGGDTIMFLAEDLTLADWETQRRIERQLLADPWWLTVARVVHQIGAFRPVRHLRHVAQRIGRGWDDTSTYDLGSWTTRTLADQLDHLAVTTHGWPDSLFVTFEEWEEVLHHQASQLRRYAGSSEQTAALDRWYDLATSTETDPSVLEEARAELDAIEAADLLAGKLALRWVAEHLDHLWD
jgi:hypothetical protein